MNNMNDEYFGKTSEIIIFAEPERIINGHILVTLMAPDNYYKLNVSQAIIWLRLILNRRLLNRMDQQTRMKVLKKSVKLYIFRVTNSSSSSSSQTTIRTTTTSSYDDDDDDSDDYGQPVYPTPFFQNQSSSSTTTTDDDDNDHIKSPKRLSFQLLATHRLNSLRHGWIKLNLTQSIRDWFEMAQQQQQQQPQIQGDNESASISGDHLNKLTLLIDCAGCNDLLGIDLGNMTTLMVRQSQQQRKQQQQQQQQQQYGGNSSKSIISTFSNHHFHNHYHHHHHHHNNNLRNSSSKTTTTTKKLSRKGQHRKHRHFRPFLVLTTKIRSKRRHRRHAYNCDDGIRQCCKQSLYVNFEELGWNDWIIYPRGYHANYCMGECIQLRTPDMLAYFHSHVLEEYRIKNPYASITPCCAPTKLSSISLIYFDQNHHIIKADLPKMVVNECGCT
nr:lateral signaling target protein 2 homolog [Dermatophagoides farinae]